MDAETTAARECRLSPMGCGYRSSESSTSPTLARWSGTVDDNRIDIIGSGAERFHEILHLIDGAQTNLRLLFYIFLDDECGTKIRDALIAAANRGVSVVLLYDCFGSSECKTGFFDPLRDAGAEVKAFSNRWRPSYLIRNHQKLIIADETRLMSGGFNVAEDYFGDCEEECWQDIGFLLEGPAVAPMVSYFDQLQQWMHLDRQRWGRLRHLIHYWDRKAIGGVPMRRSKSEQTGRLRWLVSGPTERPSPLLNALRADIAIGRRLDMIMAYFAPSFSMIRRLNGFLRRGGQGRFVMASKTDNAATIGAARILYGPLLKRGARIFEFEPRKLHSKLIIIDDVSYIGSSNFDMRSLRINLELMLRIEDADVADALRGLTDAYVAESHEVTRAQHQRDLGPFNRLRWALSYALVGILDYGVTRRLNFGIKP